MFSVSAIRSKLLLALLCVVAIALVSVSADAQTQRRRRPVKRAVPPPPSATLPAGEPEIISRAADYSETNQATPAPATPVASPTDTGAISTQGLDELRARIDQLDARQSSSSADARQKRLLTYLDILTRAEQRTESLRKQVFDMIERESNVRTRLDTIEADIRPESIERSVAIAGSLRPEELRESRRRSLAAERTNLQNLLAEIQRTRASLEQNLQRADTLVERLRVRLEQDINTAIGDDDPPAKP